MEIRVDKAVPVSRRLFPYGPQCPFSGQRNYRTSPDMSAPTGLPFPSGQRRTGRVLRGCAAASQLRLTSSPFIERLISTNRARSFGASCVSTFRMRAAASSSLATM